jgi:hypothetical protein
MRSIVKLNKRSRSIIGYWDEIRENELLWRLVVANFNDKILIFLALRLKAIVAADILPILVFETYWE